MTSGSCFDFRIVLCGGNVGLRQRVAEALTQPRAAALGGDPLAADIHHFDFDVRDCPDAALHRVHLFTLRGERPEEWEPYIARQCLEQVDVCVIAESASGLPVVELVRGWCQAANVLPVAVFDSRVDEGDTDCFRVITDGSDMDDVIAAVADGLRRAHQQRAFARELEAERAWLLTQDAAQTGPPPGAAPPPPPPMVANAEFVNHHVADADFNFSIVMIGAPGSGKSTFLSATLDDFVHIDYEPTLHLDQGTFAVREPSFGVSNVTVYDGPVRSCLHDAHALLVFLDLSSQDCVDATDALIDEDDVRDKLVVFLGTKPDRCSWEGTMEDFRRASVAIASRSAVIDARANHERMLVGIVSLLCERQLQTAAAIKEQLKAAARRSAPTPDYVSLCMARN